MHTSLNKQVTWIDKVYIDKIYIDKVYIVKEYIDKVYIDGSCELLIRRSHRLIISRTKGKERVNFRAQSYWWRSIGIVSL